MKFWLKRPLALFLVVLMTVSFCVQGVYALESDVQTAANSDASVTEEQPMADESSFEETVTSDAQQEQSSADSQEVQPTDDTSEQLPAGDTQEEHPSEGAGDTTVSDAQLSSSRCV